VTASSTRHRRQLPGHHALEAFGNGGLLGRGPGEGRVKDVLPDAHADFVFAVMGEEFGIIICARHPAIFGFIVLRGLLRLMPGAGLFVVLPAPAWSPASGCRPSSTWPPRCT
jgi:cell division protein FtsW (lipid II flippase)